MEEQKESNRQINDGLKKDKVVAVVHDVIELFSKHNLSYGEAIDSLREIGVTLNELALKEQVLSTLTRNSRY